VVFVQVIQGQVSDAGQVRAALDRWARELAPGATGWLGSTAGVTQDGRFIALARFESEEAARRNSDRPEQDQWWTETAKQTDWPQILALYGLLERMTGNPMVTLKRAVAAAMVDGPAASLALLARLDGRLAGHHRLDAVRAHLLEMAGDAEGAIAHYRTAAGRMTSLAERIYLTTQAARLGAHRA
jgi:predicted RNA polymerase sigma factor